ncbi:MAG: translesion DNA synthesis-associated protein ImuA [Serpentinimonas sp.]|nr:translesion DNA synthesis-associated protein ImuA [Serpentinimonas sp.]
MNTVRLDALLQQDRRLWRANAVAAPLQHTQASGHAGLDTELPGGGWPCGQLTELLSPLPGLEWRLLLPALKALKALDSAARTIALVQPPFDPCLGALQAQGLDTRQLLLVRTHSHADALWATEQLLRCPQVAAVLAWLPQARSEQLRRLQLACQASHQPLAFVCRPESAQQQPSPAPLRLLLRSAGRRGLGFQVFKRAGPPQAQLRWLHAGLPISVPITAPITTAPPRHAVDCSAPVTALVPRHTAIELGGLSAAPALGTGLHPARLPVRGRPAAGSRRQPAALPG